MIMKKEKQMLSKESLLKEGIEIKLTQNDIIDALVEEKIEQMRNECVVLQKEHDELLSKSNEEAKQFVDKFVKKMKLPKGAVVVKVTHNCYEITYSSHKLLRPYIAEGIQRNSIEFRFSKQNFGMQCQIEPQIVMQTQVEGFTFTCYHYCGRQLFKHSTKLGEQILAHAERVENFMNSIPVEGINEKQIAKSIKNKFTREMLKSMSSELQDTLQLKLGMNN